MNNRLATEEEMESSGLGGLASSPAFPDYITGLAGVRRPVDPLTGLAYQTEVGGAPMLGWLAGSYALGTVLSTKATARFSVSAVIRCCARCLRSMVRVFCIRTWRIRLGIRLRRWRAGRLQLRLPLPLPLPRLPLLPQSLTSLTRFSLGFGTSVKASGTRPDLGISADFSAQMKLCAPALPRLLKM